MESEGEGTTYDCFFETPSVIYCEAFGEVTKQKTLTKAMAVIQI